MTLGLWFLGLALVTQGSADDPPPGLADLEAYRAALASKPDRSAPVVGFRDLWARPEEFAGKPVQVEGRLARIFRQPRLGEFPPLVEAWVVSNVGDPFCLVFPDGFATSSPTIGTQIRFSGTFLRRIRYQAGDSARVVPLIVGPEAPASPTSAVGVGGWSWSRIDWVVGLGATAVVVAVLAGRYLSRPPEPRGQASPSPWFIDGEPREDGAPDENSG